MDKNLYIYIAKLFNNRLIIWQYNDSSLEKPSLRDLIQDLIVSQEELDKISTI